jgi:hypothetical protein
MVSASRKFDIQRRMKMKRAALTLCALLISSTVYSQTLGTNTQIPEGTCIAGVANAQVLCANSADHLLTIIPNNGALTNLSTTVYATAGYTNATNSFTNVTGLSFPVSANRNYRAICYMTWNPGGATTVGPKYIWTGPANPTAVTATAILAKTVTTASYLSVAVASFATTLDDAVAVTASITQTDVLSISVINGANAGTVQLQAALHSASGTYTLNNGSYCTVQ